MSGKIMLRVNVPTEPYVIKKIFEISVQMLVIEMKEPISKKEIELIQSTSRIDIASTEQKKIYISAKNFSFTNFSDYAHRIDQENKRLKKIINQILNRDLEFSVVGVSLDPYFVSDDISEFALIDVVFSSSVCNNESFRFNVNSVEFSLSKTKLNAIKIVKFLKKADVFEHSIDCSGDKIIVAFKMPLQEFHDLNTFLHMLSEIALRIKCVNGNTVFMVKAC